MVFSSIIPCPIGAATRWQGSVELVHSVHSYVDAGPYNDHLHIYLHDSSLCDRK